MEPMLPQPMMPSVLPVSSRPMKRFFSHLPAWVEASAAAIWRDTANIIAMACSAVVMELPKGVFITMTPARLAAGMSTLSTPMPARPITLRFLAAARTFSVTFVAERMARPSTSFTASRSASLSLPRFGSKRTSTPRSRKICTAASDSASEMRTTGLVLAAVELAVLATVCCMGDILRAAAVGRAASVRSMGKGGAAGAALNLLRGGGDRLVGRGEGPVEPRGRAPRDRRSRRCRRPRCAGPEARRGRRRCRGRRPLSPAWRRAPWRRRPVRPPMRSRPPGRRS